MCSSHVCNSHSLPQPCLSGSETSSSCLEPTGSRSTPMLPPRAPACPGHLLPGRRSPGPDPGLTQALGPTDACPLSLQLQTTRPSWALVTRRSGCGRWMLISARVATCRALPCPRQTWTPSGSSPTWPAGSSTWPRSWAAPPPQARPAGSKQVSSRAASGRGGAAGAPQGEVRMKPKVSAPEDHDPTLLW